MRAQEIQHLLPGVFQRTLDSGGPLAALLDAMETLQEPADRAIVDFARHLDPRLTPDAFVPVLARWVDLDHLFDTRLVDRDAALDRLLSTGLGRLRELVASAALLSRWRGTARGLEMFLEIATGLGGFEVDEQVRDDTGGEIAFHIRIVAPAAADPHRDLIDHIIAWEKPAHLTHELVIETADRTHDDHC